MNTQISIPIDQQRKTLFSQNLKKQGLTSKAFITQCIDAFNRGDLSLTVDFKRLKDTDPAYYNHPGFMDVNVDAETFLKELTQIK